MPSLTELASYLESIAPAQIAESWDNVGVLVRCAQEVTGVLCGKRALWGAMSLFRTTRSYFAL